MKKNPKKLPLTEQQVAHIVGGTKDMVRRYSLGDRTLPQNVLLHMQDLFRIWQEVCCAQNDTKEGRSRSSEMQIGQVRQKLDWEITQANWDACRVERTLEKMEDGFVEAGPMYAMVQKLGKENSTDAIRNELLSNLNYKLWRTLETCGPIHQLMARYRLELARMRAQIARLALDELELMEKDAGTPGKNTPAKTPPPGEDPARLN